MCKHCSSDLPFDCGSTLRSGQWITGYFHFEYTERWIIHMNSNQAFTISQRNLLLLGTIMVVVGCFLPWEIEGDFLFFWTYGIQLYPVFADNGGITVLLFGVFIIGLILRSSNFTKTPISWILACSIALVVTSVYHIVDLWIRHIAAGGRIGPPTIYFGLIMVGIGSLINLATSLIMNFPRTRSSR